MVRSKTKTAGVAGEIDGAIGVTIVQIAQIQLNLPLDLHVDSHGGRAGKAKDGPCEKCSFHDDGSQFYCCCRELLIVLLTQVVKAISLFNLRWGRTTDRHAACSWRSQPDRLWKPASRARFWPGRA